MKRSEINAIIRNSDAFVRSHHFHLPPFAYWTPAEWRAKGKQTRGIVDRGLGWDITDFGLGAFESTGLCIFTIRNGDPRSLATGRGKLYAEKLLIVKTNQITPFHFHWIKTEDIINRGGGNLVVQLYNSTEDEALENSDVSVMTDGLERTVAAGGLVTLTPGESITLPQRLYHQFWGADGTVLVGEVSTVNDDNADNRFLDPVGRFPTIEEDEEPMYPLVGDYQSL